MLAVHTSSISCNNRAVGHWSAVILSVNLGLEGLSMHRVLQCWKVQDAHRAMSKVLLTMVTKRHRRWLLNLRETPIVAAFHLQLY